jgi:sugar lactone lactonase YvrE
MSLKSFAVLLTLCFTTSQGASHSVHNCKIDGFTVDKQGTLWAAKGGHYAGVKPETVTKQKTALPKSMVDQGFATVDGFSIGKDGSYFTKGPYFIGIGAGDKIIKKKTAFKDFSAELEKAFPQGADAFGADATNGNMYFAKAGEYMGFKSDGTVLKTKTKFPAVLKNNGFDSVDSFDISGSTTYFTKGPYIIGIGEGDKVTLPKQCFPGGILAAGFYAVDGMSFDATGLAHLVKGGHYMAVSGGTVVSAKKALPASFANQGFSTIDSMAIAADGTVYVTNGDKYIGEKDGKITKTATKFSQKVLDAGFTKLSGLAIEADGTTCMMGAGSSDGYYICEKNGAISTPKTAIPKAAKDAGFGTGVDGFHLDKDGTYALSKDGYYIIGKGNSLTTSKTPLPTTLTDQLCGTASCIGPVVNGVQQQLSASTVGGAGTAGSAGTGKVSKSSYTFLAMPVLLLLGVASLL